jgi:DNA-binding MarR family transcriptional regulator
VLEYDYEDSVGYWLTTASHAIRRALEAELSRERITIRQWEVLTWLSLEGELTQADLAERMCVEAPTLTGILCRMERDGWLARHGCPDDRRCKRIRPTERAEAVWHRIAACGRRVRQQATQGLTAEELQTLKSLCARIRQNLGFVAPGGLVVTVAEPGETEKSATV